MGVFDAWDLEDVYVGDVGVQHHRSGVVDKTHRWGHSDYYIRRAPNIERHFAIRNERNTKTQKL